MNFEIRKLQAGTPYTFNFASTGTKAESTAVLKFQTAEAKEKSVGELFGFSKAAESQGAEDTQEPAEDAAKSGTNINISGNSGIIIIGDGNTVVVAPPAEDKPVDGTEPVEEEPGEEEPVDGDEPVDKQPGDEKPKTGADKVRQGLIDVIRKLLDIIEVKDTVEEPAVEEPEAEEPETEAPKEEPAKPSVKDTTTQKLIEIIKLLLSLLEEEKVEEPEEDKKEDKTEKAKVAD